MNGLRILRWLPLLAALAAGCGRSPSDALADYVEALETGDGQRAVQLLSSGARATLDQRLQSISENPAALLALLGEAGVETFPGNLSDLDSGELLPLLVSSGLAADAAVGLDSLRILGEGTSGDWAEVLISVDGVEGFVRMVREDGDWKLSGEAF